MIVYSLKQFIEEGRGISMEDGPYEWARAFYKYTDCGPWVTFRVAPKFECQTGIYYEDRSRMNRWREWVDNCIGLDVGSIVEGSDANYGPKRFEFPFDSDDFEKMVVEMDRFTSEEWERANGGDEE